MLLRLCNFIVKMNLSLVILSVIVSIFLHKGVDTAQGDDSLEKKQDSIPENEDDEIFKATNEWQVLKKGQVIPKGLHVQMNLQTGVKMAKLLDPSDNQGQTSLLTVSNQEENEETSKTKVSENKISINLDNIGAIDPETLSKVEQKYRSYKELKEDFKDLKLNVKTDTEIMNDLMEKFKELKELKEDKNKNVTAFEEIWLNVLFDIEYLIHQVDNARLFVKIKGIENIVYPSFNSSSSEIRAEGARLLGGACQNNVPSQIAALESGAIRVLLHMFLSDASSAVQSSMLYALSCIIRNFPVAQKKLVDEGGLEILNSVFDGESGEQLKLQVKVVTLVDDLLTERREVEETIRLKNTDNNINQSPSLLEVKEKQRQYNLVNLEAKLLEHNWCQHLTNILLKQISIEDLNGVSNDKQLIYQLNHDNIEKIITAMSSISNDCRAKFQNSLLLKKAISNLARWYKELSDEEVKEGDEDQYYTGLYRNIEKVLVEIT